MLDRVLEKGWKESEEEKFEDPAEEPTRGSWEDRPRRGRSLENSSVAEVRWRQREEEEDLFVFVYFGVSTE